MSYFNKLINKGLISDYPSFLKDNVHYEVLMGSIAYGVNTDISDIDIYGFCIPPKLWIFPHSFGYIHNFGKKPKDFGQFQKHHILDKNDGKEYDIVIYNIVKYFQLCMENNPNMVDSLFVPERCVLHSSNIGNHVRENRKLFLSKKSWHTFKGYAFSQLHKVKTKKYQGLEDIQNFEESHNIPKETTYDDVLKEISLRGL
jgi:predicted nucleotidyltransferase